ncbi:PREDICTED: uncharacterized protein LOC106811329 [Priapulus caudatus]|uniref:Uncharacterized protein LOC106811329 n=1 Tax=Priapulus caudatus TaxID=37621 RepID=A0ABM1EDX5_PRICU|nr:PREDICTED: uncharacterized protein LOC106811329 [Priapulus caudatus]
MSESLLLLAGDIERNPGPGGIGQENQPQDRLVDDSKQGKKEPKRRQRKPETWKKNSRKIKRAKGEAYINTRGVLVPAIKPPSPERICRCTFQCADVTAEQKASLFRELHSKPYNEQQAMISELVEVHDVRRHYRGRGGRARESAVSRRQRTPWYYLRDGARGRVRVCQGTVCDALGISRVRLQALYRKKAAGLPIEDQRGNRG